MDETASIQSDLLQSRLREKKAESARNLLLHKHTTSTDTSRRLTAGRDDNIFNDDDAAPPRRPSAARAFQSSPTVASSLQDGKSAGRRTSGRTSSVSATPRAMGARELESHADKLSKEVFSLKMDVFHLREKNEKLEKRVKELQESEDRNIELETLNEDLMAEVEQRDHALEERDLALDKEKRANDEAVVMILDHEQAIRNLEERLLFRDRRIQELEDELSSTRPSTAQHDKSRTTTSESDSVSPPKRQPKSRTVNVSEADRRVSQETSARMIELATPTKKDHTDSKQVLPSFLVNHHPSTGTLRDLYIQGNKTIRPIPSHASLLSNQTGRDNEDDILQSPALSVLSEREFGSVYGHERQPGQPSHTSHAETTESHDEGTTASPLSNDELSKAQKMDRTNRWVADAAILPPKASTSLRTFSPDVATFQSISDVLYRGDEQPEPESPTKPRKKQGVSLRKEYAKHTPPIPHQPLFGQHTFPPTPDTMTTRALNHSTSSINPERSTTESYLDPNRLVASQLAPGNTYLGNGSGSSSSKRNSMLPKEFDAYGDSDSDRGRHEDTVSNIVDDFGRSLFQTQGSDTFSTYETPMTTRYHSARGGSLMSGSDGLTDPPPRSSPSPPRVFSSRRLSAENMSPDILPSSPHLLRMRTEPSVVAKSPEHKYSVDRAPAEIQPVPPLQSSPAQPSILATPENKQPRVHSNTDIPIRPRGEMLFLSPPSSVKFPLTDTSNRAPERTLSLRQRMTRIARRTSNSTSSSNNKRMEEATGTSQSNSDIPTGSTNRSTSITRNFFRRRSLSRGESMRNTSDSGGERAANSATSAFLQAANRAAPFLNFSNNSPLAKDEATQSPLTFANGHQRRRRASSAAADVKEVRPYTAGAATAGSIRGDISDGQRIHSGAYNDPSNFNGLMSSVATTKADTTPQRPSTMGRRERGGSVPPPIMNVTERSRSRSKHKPRRDSWVLHQADVADAGKSF